jgi:hypothetical protein
MPATTTPRTGLRTYLFAVAEAADARSAFLEAEARRAAITPGASDEQREENVAAYLRMAAESRSYAAETRAEAADEEPDCALCGDRQVLRDAPCRCQSEALHPTTGERELLSSLGCEIHAEVTP